MGLSLFRIGLALFLIYDLIFCILPDLSNFYLDTGIAPRDIIFPTASELHQNKVPPPGTYYHLRIGGISILKWLDDFQILYLFIPVYALSLLSLLVGYQTKIANIIVYICHAALLVRAPFTNAGMDTLANLFVLWSLFLSLNQRFSVDRFLAIRRGVPPPVSSHPVFLLGLKIQVCFLYFFSGVLKLYGAFWRDGTALTRTVHDTLLGTKTGTILFDSLPMWMGMGFTYGVLVFQLIFPLLVFSPWRKNLMRFIAITGALLFHTSIALFLEVSTFPYLCILYLIIFIKDDELAFMLNKLSSIMRIKVHAFSASSVLYNNELSSGSLKHIGAFWNLKVGIFIAMIFMAGMSNIASLPTFLHHPLRQDIYNMASILQVYQRWPLFAPEPSSSKYHYYAEVTLQSGRVFNITKAVFEPFLFVEDGYIKASSHRRVKFFESLSFGKHPEVAKNFATRFCIKKYANLMTTDLDGKIMQVNLYFWQEQYNPFLRVYQDRAYQDLPPAYLPYLQASSPANPTIPPWARTVVVPCTDGVFNIQSNSY